MYIYIYIHVYIYIKKNPVSMAEPASPGLAYLHATDQISYRGLQKSTSTVLEAHASRHNGDPIEEPSVP